MVHFDDKKPLRQNVPFTVLKHCISIHYAQKILITHLLHVSNFKFQPIIKRKMNAS